MANNPTGVCSRCGSFAFGAVEILPNKPATPCEDLSCPGYYVTKGQVSIPVVGAITTDERYWNCLDCHETIHQSLFGTSWLPRRCIPCDEKLQQETIAPYERRIAEAQARGKLGAALATAQRVRNGVTPPDWVCDFATIRMWEAGVSEQVATGKVRLGTYMEEESGSKYNRMSGFLEGWAFGIGEVKPWVMIHGPKGAGKTHLAETLVAEVIREQGPRARFATTEQFWMDTRDSLELHLESETFHRYASIPFLALDDMGLKRPTEIELNALRHMLDQRYRMRLQTLFTNNRDLNSLAQHWAGIGGDLGALICSRIQELAAGQIINLDVPSHRRTK